jgi:predicted CoA-binding protein
MNRPFTAYHHWMINFLRKHGYAVVVVDPKGTRIMGHKADKAIIDEAFRLEQSA